MTVGEKIANIRKAKGLTRSELARKCGMLPETLRKYEAGERNPKNENLTRIANALEVSVYALLVISSNQFKNEYGGFLEYMDSLGYELISAPVINGDRFVKIQNKNTHEFFLLPEVKFDSLSFSVADEIRTLITSYPMVNNDEDT